MAVRVKGDEEYGAVLLLIVSVLVLAPFESTILRPVINTLLGLIFVFSLWTSGSPRVAVNVSALIAAICVAASVGSQLINGRTSRLVYVVIGLLMCAGTITAIVRRLVSERRVTRRTVTGALSVYLLVGLFFAFLYALIGVARAAGFFAQHGPYDPVSYLYFSYVTLTTVGYGDLTAGTDLGRMLAVLEALLGQLYLVTIVAVVVSHIGSEREPRSRGRGRGKGE
jgi:hypothetical protein